jgi:uncharacterized protein (DUF488 family)
MKFFTIGYGGRKPQEFLELLGQKGIKVVVDTRLRPDHGSMGIYVKAKSADKGVQHLLANAGIEYISIVELGNIFLGSPNWPTRYQQLVEKAGDLLTERLQELPIPFCLLCAEKRAEECHRHIIADYLVVHKGWEVEHIE